MTFGGLTTPHSDFTDILPLYIGYVLRQLQNAYIISLGRLQAIWPATSRGPLSAELLMHQRLLLGLLLTAGGFVASDRAQGTLFTVNFAGVMQSATPLHNVGDTFSGSFTLETSAALIVHPDTSFDFQSLAIQAAHVGTGWTATFNSTAIAPFTLTGTTGVISIGNNTSFGDRYNVRLTGTTTPLGTFQDFQLDLIDSHGAGADMLSAAALNQVPLLALANTKGGRLFVTGLAFGPSQSPLTVTMLQPIPEVSAVTLCGAVALLSLGTAWRARRRRR